MSGRLNWNRPHVPFGRDRGLALDAESRALRPRLVAPALTRLQDAIQNAWPGKRSRFLNSLLGQFKRGLYPTQKQLSTLNDWLEKAGRSRVASPVRDAKHVYTIRAAQRANDASAVDAMVAARPLKPPTRVA
jgi:hypothetical protein